jgi:SWI/SNF-related matrix-associated actin-dependent regulator 1 of chromatin subfamily A
MSLPLYLMEPDTSGHTYGTAEYDPVGDSWIIQAEPAVLEMAKRNFPGCRSCGQGRIRFHSTPRVVGDFN